MEDNIYSKKFEKELREECKKIDKNFDFLIKQSTETLKFCEENKEKIRQNNFKIISDIIKNELNYKEQSHII